jgi:IstB-like ATP binding protein
MLAVGLAIAACQAGYSVYLHHPGRPGQKPEGGGGLGAVCQEAADLPQARRAGGRRGGYLPLARADANLVFQLVARRYERGSILLTSNKAFSEWGQIFGDDVLASAILDRLLHHCDVISINGPSYRLKDRLKPSDGGGALE